MQRNDEFSDSEDEGEGGRKHRASARTTNGDVEMNAKESSTGVGNQVATAETGDGGATATVVGDETNTGLGECEKLRAQIMNAMGPGAALIEGINELTKLTGSSSGQQGPSASGTVSALAPAANVVGSGVGVLAAGASTEIARMDDDGDVKMNE